MLQGNLKEMGKTKPCAGSGVEVFITFLRQRHSLYFPVLPHLPVWPQIQRSVRIIQWPRAFSLRVRDVEGAGLCKKSRCRKRREHIFKKEADMNSSMSFQKILVSSFQNDFWIF